MCIRDREQLTYILIALIVAGLALGLLVVVALLARRRDAGSSRQSDQLMAAAQAAPATYPAHAAPASTAADEPAVEPADAAAAVHFAGAQPSAADHDPDLLDSLDLARPARSVRAADAPSETGRRFTVGDRLHEPGAEAAIAGFLALEPRRVPQEGPVPDPYIDPLTGLDTLLAWERSLAEENARYVRYRRPVSVVVAEIDGLGRLVDRFGAEPARRVLPETDEVAAINYVERVRVACERWLESGAVALHLSIGWASPTPVGEIDTALRAAEERMYAERRRATRSGMGGDDPTR